MHIRTRAFAAAAAATAALVGPAAMATSSSSASAASPLCIHLFIGSGTAGPLLDLHVVVLPALAIGTGSCPA